MTTTRSLSRLAPLALLPALLLAACTTADTPAPTLAFIELVPKAVTLPEGDTIRLTAIGTYSDQSVLPLTSGVTYSSAEAAKATVGDDGTITGVLAGSTTVIATAGSRTATCAVTVTAAPPRLLSIAVTPATVPLYLGGATQALTVTATFSRGPTADVTASATFASSDTAKATVTTAGVVSPVAAGTSTITATYLTKTATAAVTVTAPVLQSIAVTPATKTLAVGESQQLTVTGTYDVGPTANLTGSATFETSDGAKATVTSGGLVAAVAPGVVTITASAGGKSNTSLITVAAPVLQSIAVAPPAPSLSVGGTVQLVVTATYDVGPTADVTSSATFQTSDGGKATVSTGGLVTGVAVGPATITATYSGRTATSTVTVSATTVTGGKVFYDDFEPGVSFVSFGGPAPITLTRDTTVLNNGRATLKVVVGSGAWAGGALAASVPRDLRAYNALTFWAKVSTANTIDNVGIGDDGTARLFGANDNTPQITASWQKYVIPMPDPSRAVGVTGMFHMADGGKNYTIWYSDMQYEHLAATEVGPVTGATLSWPGTLSLAASATSQLNPAPNTVHFAVPVLPNAGMLTNVAYGWYTLTSSNPGVATVDANGLVTALSAGTTNLTATVGGFAVPGQCVVTVTGGGGGGATAPTTTLTPAPAAGSVLSMYNSSGKYTDAPGITWAASWGVPNSVSDVVIAGKTVKKYTGMNFVGVEFYANAIDATAYTHLHVDVWTPDATKFGVKLVNFAVVSPANPQTEGEVDLNGTTTPAISQGAWLSLDIPFTAFFAAPAPGPLGGVNNLQQMIFTDNAGVGGPELGTFYIDNVYFW
jgi:uncharacterized protein YjdB